MTNQQGDQPISTPEIEQVDGQMNGAFIAARRGSRTGVIVLSGSSGRVDVDRAALFAKAGVNALALRCFGAPGQSRGICEIPLETFFSATDYLISRGCQRVIFVGTSKGAEAALLAAAYDQRVSAVIAISPTVRRVGQHRSWQRRSGLARTVVVVFERRAPRLRSGRLCLEARQPGWSYFSSTLFEQSLNANPAAVQQAIIPIEKTAADINLVAGGNGALWPSDVFAQQLSRRREDYGIPVSLVVDSHAGHRILLPGEDTPRSTNHAHGGPMRQMRGLDRQLGGRP
jgi:uncharacterized protein